VRVIELAQERVVHATPEALWLLIEDTRRIPQWLAFAEKVDVLEGKGLGMKLRLHSRWRGRRSEVDVEVTQFERNRRFAWRHVAERIDGKEVPRFSTETTFAIMLDPIGGDTSVRLHAAQAPAGRMKALAIVILGRREALRRMHKSLERLSMVASIH
jgi:uncharacterized membrane protein